MNTRNLTAAVCAGWPLVALPVAAYALYSGVPGSEPYFLIALGAAIECAACAVAVIIAFGSNQ